MIWKTAVRSILLLIVSCFLGALSYAQPVSVTVDAGTPLRPINPLLYGINTARWDESLFPGGNGGYASHL